MIKIELRNYRTDKEMTARQTLERAEREGYEICTYNSPIAPAAEAVDIDTATEIAKDDPSLVYLVKERA